MMVDDSFEGLGELIGFLITSHSLYEIAFLYVAVYIVASIEGRRNPILSDIRYKYDLHTETTREKINRVFFIIAITLLVILLYSWYVFILCVAFAYMGDYFNMIDSPFNDKKMFFEGVLFSITASFIHHNNEKM